MMRRLRRQSVLNGRIPSQARAFGLIGVSCLIKVTQSLQESFLVLQTIDNEFVRQMIKTISEDLLDNSIAIFLRAKELCDLTVPNLESKPSRLREDCPTKLGISVIAKILYLISAFW